MNRLKARLKYYVKRNIKLKDRIKLILMILQFPIVIFAYIYAKINPSIKSGTWLIGETGTDAKDNGAAFFKYLRSNHNEIPTVYYISDSSLARTRISKYGTIIKTNSLLHKAYFLSSRYILSTHDGYSIPFKGVNWREFKKVYGWLIPKTKFVFLNHGVDKDDSSGNANYLRTKFDYFVTTTIGEYNDISSDRYGYPKGNVVRTGLARYDELQNNRSNVKKERNIIFMPTWRYFLADVNDQTFINSNYFKSINDLLHDAKLHELMKKNNVTFQFFPPHHEIQQRIHLFNLDQTDIEILDTENVQFSKVVLESSMMITDFSSVIFDFAMIQTRNAYFQFDLKEYRNGHYKKGYFDYEEDGFGPICKTKDELIDEISNAIDDGFILEEKYRLRINATFDTDVTNHSERLFEILI